MAFARRSVALALLAWPRRRCAQLEIKLGHVGEPGSLFQKSADEFAKRANAKLGGKAKVVAYGSSQLGGDEEMMQKLKLGTLDMALPSTVMSSQVDLFGIFEMPYLVKDRAHMAADREGDLLAEARARGREEGAQGARRVGERLPPDHQQQAADQGPRRPRRASSCACPEGKWRVKMFQAYGANPSPMKFSEVFTALQTGVMDGEENPFTQIYSAKFQEVQKYLSLSGHVYTPAYLTVGKTQVGVAAGRRAQDPRGDGEGDAGVRLRGRRGQDDAELLGKLKQAGMQVNDVDKDAFIAASKPIYEEFGKEVPGAKERDRPRGRARQVTGAPAAGASAASRAAMRALPRPLRPRARVGRRRADGRARSSR